MIIFHENELGFTESENYFRYYLLIKIERRNVSMNKKEELLYEIKNLKEILEYYLESRLEEIFNLELNDSLVTTQIALRNYFEQEIL